jgi:hypothetical protein
VKTKVPADHLTRLSVGDRWLSTSSAQAGVDSHIATIGAAQSLHALLDRCEPGLTFWIVRGPVQQNADAPHALRLLRAGHDRPCG